MKRILPLLSLAAALAGPASAATVEIERDGPVSLFPIEGVRQFADATAPGAIRYACAPAEKDLRAFFADRRAPFLPALLRRLHRFPSCHLFYEPTLAVFRAAADDEPIAGLFGALDPAGFVAGRKPLGDGLDILKFVLARAPGPVGVTLTVNGNYDPRHWPAAIQRHFGSSAHAIETRESRADGTQPWAQDYLKAGSADGRRRLLVPYRLFEGRTVDGEIYRPLLEGMEQGRFVRSKLSWEGGDLQFARDPRDRSRLVLLHGSAARAYWGKDLRPAEYAYVLRREFGADESIDLSGLSAHADYVVALLPRTNTVLFSAPVRGDAALARAAAAALSDAWGKRAPASLAQLYRILRSVDSAAASEAVRNQIQKARRDLANLEDEVPPDLGAELDSYAAANCDADTDLCFEGAGRAAMFERDPALLERALDAIADMVTRAELTPKLLGLIEAQLRTEPWPREALLDRKAAELKRLGFRVIRAPQLVPENAGSWPGVSYVNALVWNGRIFAPALGLGAYEERLLGDLKRKVGDAYEVVPVPARGALLQNGGVHCVFGVVRGELLAGPSD